MVCYLCNLLVVEEAGVVEGCVSVLIGGIGVHTLVLQQLTQTERRGEEGRERGGRDEGGVYSSCYISLMHVSKP